MSRTVLLVGGTGRTGRRVLVQLLDRGVTVRAIVRSASRLPPGVSGHPRLRVVEAELLAMRPAELIEHQRDCDAVISCLGHVLSLKGVFGLPHDLVTGATRRLCRAITEAGPTAPVRFILMTILAVNHPAATDALRAPLEKGLLWALRGLVPPSRDNQRAADFLFREVGAGNRAIDWVVVRPDSLIEGEVSAYAAHDQLVASLFKPDSSTMANVAHFMCDLATDSAIWDRWVGRMPVIVDAPVGSDPR